MDEDADGGGTARIEEIRTEPAEESPHDAPLQPQVRLPQVSVSTKKIICYLGRTSSTFLSL